jgi:hypothetical protein
METNNFCVHLSTGTAWLLSIETLESENAETALEQALVYAIKNNLGFRYFVVGSKDYYSFIDFMRQNDSQTEDEIMEGSDFLYMDLSNYLDDDWNIWVDVCQTKIDKNKYDNTYTIKEE